MTGKSHKRAIFGTQRDRQIAGQTDRQRGRQTNGQHTRSTSSQEDLCVVPDDMGFTLPASKTQLHRAAGRNAKTSKT